MDEKSRIRLGFRSSLFYSCTPVNQSIHSRPTEAPTSRSNRNNFVSYQSETATQQPSSDIALATTFVFIFRSMSSTLSHPPSGPSISSFSKSSGDCLGLIRHTVTPESRAQSNRRAWRARCTDDALYAPELYASRRWYASPNVAVVLVASGLTTLVTVLDGSAAGVTTTDMSRPPEASTGAMSTGNCRRCDGGTGV